MTKAKPIIAILLFMALLSATLSFEIASSNDKMQKAQMLPIFNLEIPIVQKDSVLVMGAMQEKVSSFSYDIKNSEEIKVIVQLKEPSEIWPNEVSSMSELDKSNLKTVMREYSINNIGRDKVKHSFSSMNAYSATLTYDQLQELANNPLVEAIYEDEIVHAFMQDSVGIIGANETWNMQSNGINLTGKGQTVCVIDTGVDYTHPDLGGCDRIYDDASPIEMNLEIPLDYPANYPENHNGTIGNITAEGYDSMEIYFENLNISDNDFIAFYDREGNYLIGISGECENCLITPIYSDYVEVVLFSDSPQINSKINITKAIIYNLTSVCDKVIGGYDFYNYDYDPMDSNDLHGTHVAGTIAANGSIKGVAPDAKIVAIKAMDYNFGITSDIWAGIDYCITNKDKYNISVISMSLGNPNYQHQDYCDDYDDSTQSYSYFINEAVDAGISVVIATGNEENDLGISSPACIQNAIRVGSSNKTDDVLSYFSNRWARDMLVAPGASINSTIPLWLQTLEELPSPHYPLDGTSMATPHVSGAIVILNQYFNEIGESRTPAQINELLKTTGKNISSDGRNYSRIDLKNALDYLLALEAQVNISQFDPEGVLNMPDNNIELQLSGFNYSSAKCYFYINKSIEYETDALSSNVVWPNPELSENYYNLFVLCNDSSGNEANDSKQFIANNAPQFISANSLPETINEGEGIWINTTWDNGIIGELNESAMIIFENFLNGANISALQTYFFEEGFFNDFKNESYFYFEPFENMTGKNITFLVQIMDSFGHLNRTETIYYNETSEIFTFDFQNNLTTYIKDITPSQIYLEELPNYSNDSSQEFNFNVTDNVDFKQVNCSLYLNEEYNQSMLIYPNGSMQQFSMNLPDNEYNYSIICIDAENNSANQSYSMEIDTIKPELSIGFPKNNEYYNSSIQWINISASDLNLKSIWHEWNGSIIIFEGNYTVDFGSDGSKTLNVWTNDLAGNIVHENISFIIDTINPEIIIESLIDGAYYNSNELWINATIVDSNFNSAIYDWNGTGIYLESYNISDLIDFGNDGQKTLTIWANDSAQNENQASISFFIDTKAPKLELNSLPNDSWTNRLFTNVSFKFLDGISENASCSLKINDALAWSSAQLANDSDLIQYLHKNAAEMNKYNFSCIDLANNYNESITYIKFDSIPPRTNASLSQSLNENGWTNQNLHISLIAQDNSSQVNKIQFRNSSMIWNDYNHNLNITQNYNGAIEYRSIDNAGNIEPSRYLMTRVDKINPTISNISLSAHVVPGNEIVSVHAIAFDSIGGSGMHNASANINGINYFMNYSLGIYIANIAAPIIEGEYEIMITAYDKAFNSFQNSINLTVSNDLPSSRASIPGNSIVKNNTIMELHFSAHDNSSIFIQSNEEIIFNGSSYQVLISGDDEFKIGIISRNAFNETIANYTYQIDSSAPQIEIVNWDDNDYANSTIMINVSANDDYNLANVSLFINDAIYASKFIEPFIFYYPTILLSDGLHNFKAIAYDSVGNQNISSVALNISNSVKVELNVSGDTNLSSGEIPRESLIGSAIDSVVYLINGLNSSSANITIHHGNYSGLSNTLGAVNISASTNANSEVYFLIPKSILENLELIIPYSNISVHAIHSNGQEQELNVSYDSLIIIGELEFERFKFITSHYSSFYFGIAATCFDGIQNQGETGVDCGGPCSACQNDDDSNDQQNPPGNYYPGGSSSPSGGISFDPLQEGNESEEESQGQQIQKTYEYANEIINGTTKEFALNKVIFFNISGNNYEFEAIEFNQSHVYLNISGYGFLRLNLNEPREIEIGGELLLITANEILDGQASISFESLSSAFENENQESLDIIAYEEIEEEAESQRKLNYAIIIITLAAASILFILKLLKIF